MTEVEIPRWILITAVVLLTIIGLMTTGLIGWANSPHGKDGRPMLLTPERQAIRKYIEAVKRWIKILDKATRHLDELTPAVEAKENNGSLGAEILVLPGGELAPTKSLTVELPSQIKLTIPPTPATQAADLYQHAYRVQSTCETLQLFRDEAERTVTPEALIGLRDSKIMPAFDAHIAWCKGILANTGAPGAVESVRLVEMQLQAHAALNTLIEALAN